MEPDGAERVPNGAPTRTLARWGGGARNRPLPIPAPAWDPLDTIRPASLVLCDRLTVLATGAGRMGAPRESLWFSG